MQRKIDKIKNRFRILKQWKIRYVSATETAQAIVAFSFNHKKTAIIYGFGKRKVPKDYHLHEVLHCAIKELLDMDKRKPKDLREAEELLVQDICKMVYPIVLKQNSKRKCKRDERTN